MSKFRTGWVHPFWMVDEKELNVELQVIELSAYTEACKERDRYCKQSEDYSLALLEAQQSLRPLVRALQAALVRLETGQEINRDAENAPRVTATSRQVRFALRSIPPEVLAAVENSQKPTDK